MIKNKKAQLMSLDVLFTVVLLILMFFLLFNVIEARTYQRNTDIINSELNSIGDIAFTRLINNPILNCSATDAKNKFHIPACLSTSLEIKKRHLGVPDNYKCNISISGGNAFAMNECEDDFNLDDVSNYYEKDFYVSFINPLTIKKIEYISSYTAIGSHLGSSEKINLKVWKE